MAAQSVFQLVNHQTNNLAFKVCGFNSDADFNNLTNYNYYSMILVTKGNGSLIADVSEYGFSAGSLICFAIYQRFKIKSEGIFEGIIINFHADFFCLHKHRSEVSCNGVVFNNIYESPVMQLDKAEIQSMLITANELKTELQNANLAQHEVLLSYLKIFLINASRIKIKQQQSENEIAGKGPLILNILKDAIEAHYRTLHSPADYAEMLHISAKALNRVSKAHFNKTLSSLIAERIIIEAKRELYLTAKTIKLIAYELGFNDEFYFSRFFKSNVAVSPQIFRDTVGFDRANA